MPLPVGTYPIGGPMVLTGEKPAATAELFEAGARWIGPNGTEVIERGGDNSYSWVVKAGSAGAAEQRVLVDVPASASTRDKIIEEDSQLYTTQDRIVHQAVAAQATFQSIRFDLGYFSDESALDPRFYTVGRYYYNFARYTPRVVAYVSGNSGPKQWVDGRAEDLVANITGDVGHFGSDEEATPHVAAVGNVYYHERLRVYRRAVTFNAGAGPVTSPQRLRQANADDLERIDGELRDSISAVMAVSPQYIDIGNRPTQFEVTLFNRVRHYDATIARFRFLELAGDTAEQQRQTRIDFPFTRTTAVQGFRVVLSPLQQARLATYGPRGSIVLICELRNDDGDRLETISVTLATVQSLSVGGRTATDAIADLERRASDLRVVAPPGWETAVGTDVGISLARALVADPGSLSYQSSVDIPADADAGDDYIMYMAIPTGSNLSDYRVNLDDFAEYPGFNFGEVTVAGDNTIYSYLFTVGDGSGGFASGTAPGATLTLQHHGTTPHTAYSGELEGRALQQLRDEAGSGDGGGGGGSEGGESSGSYTLPQATESRLGGVRGATAAQSQAASGVTVLGWSLNRLKTVVQRNIAAATTSMRGGALLVTQAIVDAGTSTAGYIWNISNLLRLIRSQIASWARSGDASTIPALKLGGGSPTNATFLRGDGTWQTPTGTAASLTLAQQIGLVKFAPRLPTFAYRSPSDFIRSFDIIADGSELVTGDLWFQRRANGSPIGGRVKWTSNTNAITFAVAQAAQGTNFTNQVFLFELWFYDAAVGGSVVEVVRIPMGINYVDKPFALTSSDDIIFDVDSSAHGIYSVATLTLQHSGDASIGQTGAQLTVEGGRNGSTAVVQITQGARPLGGWPIQLKDVELFGGISAPVLSEENGAVDLLEFHRIGNTWYYVGRLNDEPEDAPRPLTLAQQTGLTHANILPNILSYSGAADLATKLRRTFQVSINDRAEITSPVYLQVDLSTNGRALARHNRALLGAAVNDVSVGSTAGISAGIAASAAADLIAGGELRIDLVWFSADANDAQVSRQRYLIPVTRTGAQVIRNIASYDATQNRFEDSGGNAVTVPDGAIVALAESVYDAAVTDADFTPNPSALFVFTS